MMLGSSSESQLPVSHVITGRGLGEEVGWGGKQRYTYNKFAPTGVNSGYTYNNSVPVQPFCFSPSVQYSVNSMRYSTL